MDRRYLKTVDSDDGNFLILGPLDFLLAGDGD